MRTAAVMVIAAGCWSSALAQPEEGVLAGPRVVEAAPARVSIVSTDFNGKVRRPECTPEESAMLALGLDEAALGAARARLVERERLIDEFVGGNLDLLTKFQAASAAGDKKDLFALGLEAAGKLKVLRDRGPLRDELRAALPEASRGEFDRLLNEYWSAVARERASAPKADGKRPGRIGIIIAERLEILGREIERSFRRMEKSGDLAYRFITTGLDLNPQQAARIREVCARFAEESAGSPTREQETRLALGVASFLDEAQRTALVARFRGR